MDGQGRVLSGVYLACCEWMGEVGGLVGVYVASCEWMGDVGGW